MGTLDTAAAVGAEQIDCNENMQYIRPPQKDAAAAAAPLPSTPAPMCFVYSNRASYAHYINIHHSILYPVSLSRTERKRHRNAYHNHHHQQQKKRNSSNR